MDNSIPRFTTRRKFLLGASGTAAAALLVACGAPAPAATKPAEQKPAAPTTAPAAAAKATEKPSATAAPASASGSQKQIRLMVRAGTEADTLSARIPPFQETNAGVTVKIESVPSNEYFQKLQTLTAGDQLADVVWLSESWGWHRRSAKTGTLISVSDLVLADKLDLSPYYKAAINSLTYEGKLWGLPFKANSGSNLIFMNLDALEKAGVKPPTLDTTLEELGTMASKATQRTGNKVDVWGFVAFIKGGGHHMATFWARTFGGEALSEDGTKALLNSDGAKAGLRYQYDLIKKYKGAPSLKDVTGNLVDMFTAGAGAMYQAQTGDLAVPTRIKDKFKVSSTLMPKGPTGKRGSLMALDFLGINAKSKIQKEAWELTKWMCDKETGIRLGEGTGGASGTAGARTDVMKDPRIAANPLRANIIDGIISAEPARLAANFRDAEYWDAVIAGLEPLWLGDSEPTDKFFNDLNAEIQKILDKPVA